MTVKELREALKGVASDADVYLDCKTEWTGSVTVFIDNDGDVRLSPTGEQIVANVLHRD